MRRFYQPDLGSEPDSPFARDGNNKLVRRGYWLDGYWCGTPEGKHISGVTVADLARDGMFSVERNSTHGSALLTERGQWFARTLIEAASEVLIRE